jgi:hypothetical protein
MLNKDAEQGCKIKLGTSCVIYFDMCVSLLEMAVFDYRPVDRGRLQLPASRLQFRPIKGTIVYLCRPLSVLFSTVFRYHVWGEGGRSGASRQRWKAPGPMILKAHVDHSGRRAANKSMENSWLKRNMRFGPIQLGFDPPSPVVTPRIGADSTHIKRTTANLHSPCCLASGHPL